MKKILIVEDDFYISKLYSRTFTLSGYQVDTAISGKEALEKGKLTTYDVILLDVMLGDMSGLDVLKVYKAAGHPALQTPVFLSTNRGEDEIVKEGFAIGIEGYFLKSQYIPQDIVAEINTFFSRQEGSPAEAPVAPPVAPVVSPPVAPAPVQVSPTAPVIETASVASPSLNVPQS